MNTATSPAAAASTCPVCGGAGSHAFASPDRTFGGTRLHEYHRCGGCGAEYHHPMPELPEIATFYREGYSIFTPPDTRGFSRAEALWLRERLGYAHLQVPPPRSLRERLARPAPVETVTPWQADGAALDVGAGNGEYLLKLRSVGWTVRGVELDARGAALCREQGLDIVEGELADAGFAEASFDLVTAHHVIEHVRDPQVFMAGIARVVKPGGTVLIRTPNRESPGRRLFGTYWFPNETPRHLVLYTQRALRALAARHGLECVAVSTPAKPKLVLRSLDHLLGNRGKPSEKNRLLRWIAKLYVPVAHLLGQGDELCMTFRKRA